MKSLKGEVQGREQDPLLSNTPWAPTGPKRIEDAMRRDTAAPAFWSSAFRDPFAHVGFACYCLAIVWLILFDLVRSCQVLG